MQTLTITVPDDFHIHLRDGDYLTTTVPHCASYCARAIIMPNLKPPITNTLLAQQYRQRILDHLPPKQPFQPLMTLYLTEQTTPEEIVRAKQSGIIFGAKFYPAGATTHSQAGIRNWENIHPVFETMQQVDLPLLIHGEVTNPLTDIFDREALFISETLEPLHRAFPQLRIVLEHISTEEAVNFITEAPSNIAATITVHHLLLNRNDLFSGGIQPHQYCAPIIKRAKHQQALIKAATTSRGKFFMGTDSAPHSIETKETSCGCAGIYSAPVALPLYATVFETANALDKLEGFCSHFGAQFYQLPVNQATITLQQQSWRVPSHYEWGNSRVVPLYANQTLNWQIINEKNYL
jgi:dihydroorotase